MTKLLYLFPVISNIFFFFPAVWLFQRINALRLHFKNLEVSDQENRLLEQNKTNYNFARTVFFCYFGPFVSFINLITCSTYYHVMVYCDSSNLQYIWIDYFGISVCICNGMIFLSGLFTPIIKVITEVLVIIIQLLIAFYCRHNTDGDYYALLALPGFFMILVLSQISMYALVKCCNKYNKCNCITRIHFDLVDCALAIILWVVSLVVFEVSKHYYVIRDYDMYNVYHSIWHLCAAISMVVVTGVSNKNVSVFSIISCNFKNINKLTSRERLFLEYNYNYLYG